MGVRHSSQAGFSPIQFFLCVTFVCVIVYFASGFYEVTRERARNTARNQAAEAYTRVLALFHVDRGSYPKVDSACLGDYADDRCWVLDFDPRGDIPEVAAFNERLRSFVDLTPGDTVVGTHRDGRTTSYEGYIYRSPQDSPYGYQIEWMLETRDARCALDAEAKHGYNGFDVTYCVYTHHE